MADDTTYEWAFRGAVGALFTLGWWLWNRMVEAVKGVSVDMKTLERNLTEHEMEAERRYAKEDHVNANLERINGTLGILQNTINTATVTMAASNAAILEKISGLAEKLNYRSGGG